VAARRCEGGQATKAEKRQASGVASGAAYRARRHRRMAAAWRTGVASAHKNERQQWHGKREINSGSYQP